jgi:spore coat polysaccharide biosynthesis predicted glycosyltransferase SpsG
MEMLKRNWVVYFVGSGLPEELLESESSVIQYIEFVPELDSMKDTKNFITLLTSRFRSRVNFIIFDSYRFKRNDYAVLQLFANQIPVAVINDLAEQDTPAQVVINPNPMFSPEPYQRQKIPCILCGEQYALVRPEIVARRERKYDQNGPLLISLGGGDVVEPLMKVLASLPAHFEKKVLVSVSGNCPVDELFAWAEQQPQKRRVNVSSKKFPALLGTASLAITGGGGTLWEVYCLGIPSLCIVWVDNQKNASTIIKDQATSMLVDLVSNINIEAQSETLHNSLQKIVKVMGPPGKTRFVHEKGFRTAQVIDQANTSLGVDDAAKIDARFLRKAISRLSSGCGFPQEMVQRQRQLIDGQGAKRVVDALEKQSWEVVPLFSADYRRTYEDW